MTIPNKIQCRLCKQFFENKEMSEEHYPARSVGNDDIVALDILKLFDSLMSDEHHKDIIEKIKDGQSYEKVMGDYFDTELSKSLYPKGRTARTLCRQCNTFLGNYDKAYLKFYNNDGNPNVIKGFQKQTKHNIIPKAVTTKSKYLKESLTVTRISIDSETVSFIYFPTNSLIIINKRQLDSHRLSFTLILFFSDLPQLLTESRLFLRLSKFQQQG